MIERKCGLLLGLFGCVIFAACDSGADEKGPVQLPVATVTYPVGFSPVQIVGGLPAPPSVSASADIYSAQDDVTTLNGSVTVNGADPERVTINAGYPGENGPEWLELAADGDGLWQIPADTVLDESEYDRLSGSGYYVSIRFLDSELRGQVLRPGLIPATVPVDASEAVPTVNSSGSATAGFLLDPNTGFVRLRLSTFGIEDATGAGLRGAVAGARGEVFVPMEASRTDPDVWGTADINDPGAEEFLTQEGAGFIITGSSYFSLETASNPGGELRGQLVPEGIAVVDVPLEDGQVVRDGPAVESSAGGTATVTWNRDFNQLSVAVNTDIENAISVGVYQAAAGEIGPLVLSLMPDVTLPGNWIVQLAEITDEQASALNDDLLYVSVVTEAFPEGELRGQILLDPALPVSLQGDAE